MVVHIVYLCTLGWFPKLKERAVKPKKKINVEMANVFNVIFCW